jgi:hypothetical protein
MMHVLNVYIIIFVTVQVAHQSTMSIVLSDSMRSLHTSVDAYGSTKVSAKTNLIDLKSIYGLKTYRNKIVQVNSGAVTNDGSRFCVSVTDAGDKAELISCERGTYVAGFSSECGLGLQVDPSLFTGSQVLDFGYFDDNDGYFFRISNATLSLHVRKAGTTVAIDQSTWNGDHGVHSVLNIKAGLVFHINFTWYGYGSILFSVVYSDAKGSQINRLLHSYAPTSGISTCNPNLPINVSLSANDSAGPIAAYVGGRSFSIQGKYQPKFRVTQSEESVSGIGTVETPVVSYAKTTACRSCPMVLYELDVITTQPVIVSVRVDAELTDATFAAPMVPEGCQADYSGLQRDTDATGVACGYQVYSKMLPAGYTTLAFPTSLIIDERPLSITCRALGASADVQAVVRIQEFL